MKNAANFKPIFQSKHTEIVPVHGDTRCVYILDNRILCKFLLVLWTKPRSFRDIYSLGIVAGGK